MQETLYNRQWMQLSLYQTEDAGVSKVDPGVYRADVYTQTVDARGSISDRCREQLQESLYQTADARDYIRQWMQESLYRQRLQESQYQTADARDSISDS